MFNDIFLKKKNDFSSKGYYRGYTNKKYNGITYAMAIESYIYTFTNTNYQYIMQIPIKKEDAKKGILCTYMEWDFEKNTFIVNKFPEWASKLKQETEDRLEEYWRMRLLLMAMP